MRVIKNHTLRHAFMYHTFKLIYMPQSHIFCVNKRDPWFVFRESLARVHVYMETFRVFEIFESPAYTVSRPLPYGEPHIPKIMPYVPHILSKFFLLLYIIHFEWIHVTRVPTWTSYQIRKMCVAHAPGIPGLFSLPSTSKQTTS